MNLEVILEQVLSLVKETGRFMREHAATRVEHKEGHANFVTDMDVAVQKRIIAGIQDILPEAAIMAEESDNHVEAGLQWVIDPIDGTTNFICDYRHSCICVGLVENDESILGVIGNPYTEEYFYAAKGLGAFLNGQPMHVSARPAEQAIIGFGTSPYHTELSDITFRAAKTIFETCADIRRSGSAGLDLAYVACGRLDGFFEYILSPWDYAAGACLITEAGGSITGIGEDLTFSRPVSICATSPAVRDTVYPILTER